LDALAGLVRALATQVIEGLADIDVRVYQASDNVMRFPVGLALGLGFVHAATSARAARLSLRLWRQGLQP